MMKATKKLNQRKHAKRRAFERFHLSLTTADLNAIAAIIQTGKAIFVRRQSMRLTVWNLQYQGRDVKVVYDSNRKNIVTFMHPVLSAGDKTTNGAEAPKGETQ